MFKKKINITFRIGICMENDDDRFHAYCPALEGVHVDGETREEAVENAKLAVELYIQSLIKHGDPIPLQVIRMEQTEEPSQGFTCPPQQTENVLVTI